MSVGKQKSGQSSKPLTPGQVAGYYNTLDSLTGGTHVAPTTTQRWVPDGAAGAGGGMGAISSSADWLASMSRQNPDGSPAGGHWETVTTPGQDSPGRLSAWAQGGTPAVDYQGLTGGQLRALGGAGASREQAAADARRRAIEEINANAGLDVTQKLRATQLQDADTAARLDAIRKETEAQMTQLASQEAARQYGADVRNADLTKEDLAALAQIFFGGKGATSKNSSSNFNLGL